MDEGLIYTKTAAGELAMRERTRLIQRNLRMILILVDGQTSVAALKGKVADGKIVAAALSELEQMGLVEALRSNQVRHAVAADDEFPAIAPLADDPLQGADRDFLSQSGIPTQPPREFAALVEDVVLPPEPFAILPEEVQDVAVPTAGPASINGKRPWQAPASNFRAALARFRGKRPESFPNTEDREFESAYEEEAKPIPVRIRPVRRGRRPAWAWPWRLLMGLLAVAAFLFGLIVLYPFDHLRPRFETAAAQALHSPVKIGAVRFTFSPHPALTLEDIVIGGPSPYAWVDRVRLMPELATVFSDATALAFSAAFVVAALACFVALRKPV